MKTAIETAFLPAALEIEHTPPSPAGRWTLWSILSLFSLGVAWASIGEVDIVAVAQGRIIPSGHSKTLQPLEIGTVTSIHVKEGQVVQAGDTLIELDATSAQADVDRMRQERDVAAREVRRHAQLAKWLASATPPTETALAGVDSVLHRQWREFEDRVQVLQREKEQKHAERRSAQQQVDKREALLPIVTRRARDQHALAEQKLLAEQQYLESEQARIEVLHDLRMYRAQADELGAAVNELDARIGHVRSEQHRQALEQHEAAEKRLHIASQELIKAEARLRAQTIGAPVSGVVQQLAVHNVGAVVTPAQALMVIVPGDGSLEVEATLENKDIGFVEVGQPVEIKIDTFPFTRYGTIAGEVTGLSGDAVADEHKGLVYTMRVRMEQTMLQVNDRAVRLSPGMTVTVESKTGTRRLIEFFLSPLLQYVDESARER